MKIKALFKTFSILCLCALSLSGCQEKQDEGRKITGYEEYRLTVASRRLPGVVTSCGNTVSADVFAVKKDGASEWEPLPYISEFDYEEGYEYVISLSRTDYLDYAMGEPAWTEYKLLEVISKESKESEDLPESFIPDWFREPYRFEIKLSYFIDADDKETIENDLKSYTDIPAGALLLNGAKTRWQLCDKENAILAYGTLQLRGKDSSEFPESYLNLPPSGSVTGSMEWTFIYKFGGEMVELSYDVFITAPALKSTDDKNIAVKSTAAMNMLPARHYNASLYKDVTDYYARKYPDAGVRTVVYSLALEGR
ncbi:MAG: DUF4377 domain-containing protein [Bacteroidales bacterium]|nr:DUF4377 domain-containing protein [Bacteroidales bacterium]